MQVLVMEKVGRTHHSGLGGEWLAGMRGPTQGSLPRAVGNMRARVLAKEETMEALRKGTQTLSPTPHTPPRRITPREPGGTPPRRLRGQADRPGVSRGATTGRGRTTGLRDKRHRYRIWRMRFME